MQKIFIGVSWPYTNGNIHLGHLAGQNVVCDVFARYHRLRGNKVLMVSGGDCHGAPVVFAAEEQGIKPIELSEKYLKQIVETFDKLGLVYENFTKTTTENHKIVVQNIFNLLNEQGFLTVKKSNQYYDPKVERFLPDRYVRGTCPNCKAENARGDECPNCGAFLEPEQLINPYSTLSDATPIIKETEHFYIDLAKTDKDLSKWLENKDYWRNWVREFTKGWIKQGLEPRPVTRDMNFGVPVPVEGWEDKVIYVWIEAVVGYLSAAIEWADKQGNPDSWQDFWKDPECKHYYFIAGGNVPFHTIIWPAEIIAYNSKYNSKGLSEKYRLPGESDNRPLNLPYDVPANKILLYKGKKMSKGDKTGVTVEELLKTYNPDLIRYFFVRYAPENNDREYTWKDFIDSNNNELVANLGNFINRVLTFTDTKFNGIVPEGRLESTVTNVIKIAFDEIGKNIENTEFIKSTEALLRFGDFANKYFNDEKPWETIKTEPHKASQTIYNAIQMVNALRILIKPLTPEASLQARDMLNLQEEYDPTEEVKASGSATRFEDLWRFTEVEAGHRLNKPNILFEKLEYRQEEQ